MSNLFASLFTRKFSFDVKFLSQQTTMNDMNILCLLVFLYRKILKIDQLDRSCEVEPSTVEYKLYRNKVRQKIV